MVSGDLERGAVLYDLNRAELARLDRDYRQYVV
jgi:hypothetical protein